LQVLPALTTNLSLYVNGSTGSDSNAGTIGSPFATIMKAIDTLAATYGNGFSAEIFVADGTYSENVVLKSLSGYTLATLTGNTTTPASCIISATGIGVNRVSFGSNWTVRGFRINTSGSACLGCSNGQVSIGNMTFGTNGYGHIAVESFGYVVQVGPITFTGNATVSVGVLRLGIFACSSQAITYTGSPTFTIGFTSDQSNVFLFGVTWTGSFTGIRYRGQACGVFQVQGANTTYIPGSSAGTLSGNSVYVVP
jgi:hypothetical protein